MNIDQDKIITVTTSITDIKTYYYLGRWVRHTHILAEDYTDAQVEINIGRAELQEKTKELPYEYEYVLLLDSSIETNEEGLNKLVEQYNGYPICARIDDKYTIHNHDDVPNCACCLMDKETYHSINYLENPEQCQCYKIPNAVYADGVTFRKIENLNLTFEPSIDSDNNIHIFNEETKEVEVYSLEEYQNKFEN